MATQGMVSVVSNGSVMMKIIAGTDGYNASKLADWLRIHPEASADEVFEYSLSIEFGSRSCLVIQTSPDKYVMNSDSDDLPELYKTKFSDPEFNPRWEIGSVDHLVIIQR